MQVTRSSAEGTTATTKGPAEWFTGDVYSTPRCLACPVPRAGGSLHAGRGPAADHPVRGRILVIRALSRSMDREDGLTRLRNR